jgi:hypothetical protein
MTRFTALLSISLSMLSISTFRPIAQALNFAFSFSLRHYKGDFCERVRARCERVRARCRFG